MSESATTGERMLFRVRVRYPGNSVRAIEVWASDASEAIATARPDINEGTIASVSVLSR